MKKQKNRKITVLSVFLAFFVCLFVFLMVWWFGASHPAFEKVARQEAHIPGLSSGISPQGLCALPENEQGYRFAMSGYISGKPSRVYLISEDADAPDTFVTFEKDGKPVETHFGGVTCSEKFVYIASGDEIIRAKLSDVIKGGKSGVVPVYDSFKVGLGAAFCYLYRDQLFVGEFYRPGNYETDPSHHLEVNGKVNHAFIYLFDLDEDAAGGIAQASPSKILSVPDQVQGIAVTDEKIFLSTSYGLPDSKLYVYENKLNGEPDGYKNPLPEASSERPLYILEPKAADLVMPCMSEEICIYNGRLYILFESLSKKYRLFVRTRLAHIYSISLSDLV